MSGDQTPTPPGPPRRRRRAVAVCIAALTVVVVAVSGAQPASAGERRTVFATRGATPATSQLWRLTLDGSGAVIARTAVQHGLGGVAVDTADGRTLFVRALTTPRRNEIWVREKSGQSRFLTRGDNAAFTPGRSAMLFTRAVHDADGQVVDTQLLLYYFADARVRALSTLSDFARVADIRFTNDAGRVLLMTWSQEWEGTPLVVYGVPERRVLRTRQYGAGHPCVDVELLPGGLHALVACHGLWTVRISDGAVTRVARPPYAGAMVSRLHGRLCSEVVLVSAHTTEHPEVPWLGALDLDSLSMRRLVGTTGYRDAVTAY